MLNLLLSKRTKTILLKIKRATISVALFFASLSALAQTTRESHKDIIEKSYSLSLQDDRKQAIHILLSALKKEKRQVAVKELSAALLQVASRFYSDKNQQAFEVGIASFFDDPAAALSKLNELEKSDPANLEIIKTLALLQLRQGSCGGASNEVNKLTDFVPYSEEVRLLHARTMLCSGDLEGAAKYALASDLKKGKLSVFWLSVLMEVSHRRGLFVKTTEYAAQASKQAPDFPESGYWAWKANADAVAAQKYLSQCKGINPRLKRSYLLEPTLCSRLSEVESFLKKSDNPSI